MEREQSGAVSSGRWTVKGLVLQHRAGLRLLLAHLSALSMKQRHLQGGARPSETKGFTTSAQGTVSDLQASTILALTFVPRGLASESQS